MGEEISHCPGCGRRLRFDELLDRPPAQMDIAIELEHHVSAIREIRNQLQHIEESLTGYGPLITEKMEYCVDSLGPVPEKLTSVRDLLEKVAVNQ